ncbi:MAG: pyruvoyl-dependent arginine decarboxylase [Planctomycetota bacterium]|jgi:arginine decarboxylase
MKIRGAILTKGVGCHREKLASFEEALRCAKIAHLNLVSVSSILPAGCKVIPRIRGLGRLDAGDIAFTVLARNQTEEHRRLVAASVGMAVPKDPNLYGYLSEHVSFGQTQKEAGDYAEDLAASMLATTLGLEFDVDAAWDEKKEIYKVSGKIFRTRNITQTAVGKQGLWTTVIAAAVFITDKGNSLPLFKDV